VLQARLFNSFISHLIETDSSFSLEGALAAAHLNFGAQINGSWRNQVGVSGSEDVKALLLNYFAEERLVKEAVTKGGVRLSPASALRQVSEVQRFALKNGYEILFSSEPDVSVHNPKGITEVAIEVKAGLDPAGALERYGACKKSFDRALEENKAATTIYLASCITPGVRRAMKRDRLVKEDYDLGLILTKADARLEFLDHLRWLVHL
jgi:hypothetical protein